MVNGVLSLSVSAWLSIQHHGKEESSEDSEVRLRSYGCGFPQGDDEPDCWTVAEYVSMQSAEIEQFVCTYTALLFCEYNQYTDNWGYNQLPNNINYNIFDLHTSKITKEVSETDVLMLNTGWYLKC